MFLNLKHQNSKCIGSVTVYVTLVAYFVGVQVADSNEPTEHVSHRHSTELSNGSADGAATSSKTHHVSALQA